MLSPAQTNVALSHYCHISESTDCLIGQEGDKDQPLALNDMYKRRSNSKEVIPVSFAGEQLQESSISISRLK